jgi:hypothetical protein
MEKDNKSVPMRVFSNTMTSFPIDTKGNTATTSMLQQQQQTMGHRHHAIHPRLTDIQMCSNDIIDLSSAAAANLNAQARSYELTTNINGNMMSIYDVNNSNIASFADIAPPTKSNIVNNLDILKGISKGTNIVLLFLNDARFNKRFSIFVTHD